METVYQLLPYALAVLVAVLFYFFERDTFQKIALSAFVAVEKELSTAEGQEKMASAVEKIINALPAVLKTILTTIASLMGTDLHGLTHKLAQATYDVLKEKFPTT